MITGDPVPSLALLNRALSLLSSTKSELDSALRRVGKLPTAEEDRASITAMKEQSEDIERLVRLERTRLRARAVEAEQSGLSKAANQLSGIKIDSTAVENKQTPLLIDRLEDPNFVPDPRNLVDFPPNFVPVPCKPLFFDLAAGHIEYPLDRIAARGKKQAEEAKAAGGITGWLGGLWSKK